MLKNKIYSAKSARFSIISILIIAILTCGLIGVSAKYFSEINGTGSLSVAKFIIKGTSGNENLVLTPDIDGGFAAYEFWVSNSDGGDVSEVSQFYYLAMAIPNDVWKAILELSEDGGLDVMPFLVSVDNDLLTFDDIVEYAAKNDVIPENVSLWADDKMYVIEEQDVIPDSVIITWGAYTENNEFIPQSFNFSAGKKSTHKYFIVFTAIGRTLLENEEYDFSGVKVFAYSEQIEPN